MSTMYNLTDDYKNVLAMAGDTEIDPQAITDTLEAIAGEIEDKAESCQIVKLELKAEVAKIKAEIDRLTARAKSLNESIARIDNSVYNAMTVTGKTKFKTTLFNFSIVKNPPKLVIDDPKKIPEKYLIPQDPKIDSTAIKADIKDAPCDWAHLEQSKRLSVR